VSAPASTGARFVAAAAALLAPLLVGASADARSGGPIFSLSIGYNGLPPGADAELAPLRFADDDAAAFHEFASTMARRAFLLAVLDADTQTRFPSLAQEARAPSLAELRRTMREIEQAVDAAVAEGAEPTVLVFYSGHGAKAGDDQGALTFVDGLLTREMLYEEILAPLHARFVHLFVDACNAEAVVRPRDLQAKVVESSPADLDAAFRRTTLARFPGVGAVVASTAGAQAHEWDVYQSGIFTHEILSALRGAADVDGNHRIEYSELAAFLGAANREVGDPRARPHTIVRAPSLDGHAAIVDLDDARDAAFIEGRPGPLGALFIEDARGNRLLDLRAEPALRVSLAVPAGETLYLHTHTGGAAVRLVSGQRLTFDRVQIAESDTRARGALASALRRGLFATSFGPGYYRGFVDHQEDMVAVEPREADLVPAPEPQAATATPRVTAHRRAAWISFGAASALAVTAGVLGGLTWQAHDDFENTYLEKPAMEANTRYQRDLTLSITSLVAAAVAGGIGAWLLYRDR
jgi:hypothetical protein